VTGDDPTLPRIPEGFTVFALPGWAMRNDPADTELVPAGGLLLPRSFYVAVTTPENVSLVLQFAVNDGEVRLPQVWSQPEDVPQALDILRKVEPVEFWRRYAITKMVTRALAQQLTDEAPDDAESVVLGGDGLGPDVHVFLPALADIARHVQAVPAGTRRNRITSKHLAEVAEVYRRADADGRPPTRAVADHFQTSHSTAARWVGLARERKLLAPAKRGQESGE
jgi:hypothetical protein